MTSDDDGSVTEGEGWRTRWQPATQLGLSDLEELGSDHECYVDDGMAS